MKWYDKFDKLKEPYRFWVFFISVATLIAGVLASWIQVNIISWGLLAILLITRIIYNTRSKI